MLTLPLTRREVFGRNLDSPLSTHWEFPGQFSRSHTVIQGVTYKVADTRKEREEAFRLVYESYRNAELIPVNDFEMRVTPYHLLDTTDVYVALHEGRVVYTVTLVADGREGLPLEAIYADEVQAMRQRGEYLSEVSCLAGRDGYFDQKQGFQVFVNLIGLMIQSARYNQIDKLLLAVHPRHARFYQRFFGCDCHGAPRAYSAVLGNPAVLCVHDFEELDERKYRLFDDIYQWSYQRWELRRQPMAAEERDHFACRLTAKLREMVAVGA